jgi:type II secretory pathway predicted ATPase ExeA
MNFSKTYFADSLEPDRLDASEASARERRLNTYSVDALRAAADVERIYVKHSQFSQVIEALDKLFQVGTELDTPMGFRLIGPPGVGKTAAFAYFRATLPSSTFFDKSTAAIGVRLPKRPHTGVVIKALLRGIEYPFAEGSYKQLYARRTVIFEALQAKGTRLIWIDEAHHLIFRNTNGAFRQEEGDASDFLREIVDRCRCSMVLAGSTELDDLPAALPHLSSRIPGRLLLEPFSLDSTWRSFIEAFCGTSLPVNLRSICTPAVMTALHKATGGNLRMFRQLMIEAVLLAMQERQSNVDTDTLSKAYDLAFGVATRSNPFVS